MLTKLDSTTSGWPKDGLQSAFPKPFAELLHDKTHKDLLNKITRESSEDIAELARPPETQARQFNYIYIYIYIHILINATRRDKG